jgi:hypothetical protein
MNLEIGTVAAQSFSGNICFEFSVLVLFRANVEGRTEKFGRRGSERRRKIPVGRIEG